jgi:DNA-binding NarL/FixJ family response regulator
MTPLNVLIVADDLLARTGLVMLLDSAESDLTLEQGDSSALDDDLDDIDVVVIDLGWDGSRRLDDWRELDTPVVALVPDGDSAQAAWASGALGIVGRGDGINQTFVETVVAAIHAVYSGLTAVQPDYISTILPLPGTDPDSLTEPLTPRENEVLSRLAEGDTNKAIALALGISDSTVKFHVNAVLTKLGAQSRTEAVVRALRLGILAL